MKIITRNPAISSPSASVTICMPEIGGLRTFPLGEPCDLPKPAEDFLARLMFSAGTDLRRVYNVAPV